MPFDPFFGEGLPLLKSTTEEQKEEAQKRWYPYSIASLLEDRDGSWIVTWHLGYFGPSARNPWVVIEVIYLLCILLLRR